MTESGKAKREMDMEVALSHVGGDMPFLAELAEIFLHDYPRLMEEMRQSIAQDTHSELERAAHTLKGRLAFFGLNTVRDKAFCLEMMGREHNSANAARALTELELAMEGILPELTTLVRESDR